MDGGTEGRRKKEEERVDNDVELSWVFVVSATFLHFCLFLGTPPVEFTQVGNLISPQSFLDKCAIFMVLHPYEGPPHAPEAPHCVSQQPVLPRPFCAKT